MNRKLRASALFLSSTAIAMVGLGCGGAGTTNNDQGIAVTLAGYYEYPIEDCSQTGTGLVGIDLPLGAAVTEPTDSDFVTSASAILATVGIQNNLIGQFYRADRLYIEYFIPGASLQPPATTIPMGFLVGPAPRPNGGGAGGVPGGGGGGAGGGNTTGGTTGPLLPSGSALPPSFNAFGNFACAGTTIIPAAIREWLNFNRDSLPEPPFQMTITSRVTGLTSAGDRFDTNTLDLLVNVVPETFVTPTEGEDEDGTGGLIEGDTDAVTEDNLTGDEGLSVPEDDASGFEDESTSDTDDESDL